MKRGGVYILLASIMILVILAGLFSFGVYHARQSEPLYGATFSQLYAQQFGLDWQETYRATLDELELSAVRIPVYWSSVEFENDRYFFDDIDWMLNEAAGRDVDVTLVIGQKVPRWPECYIPDWAEAQSHQARGEHLLDFMKVIVERYEHHPALARWQVENESFFPFGECPVPDPDLIEREIKLVRMFDDDNGRPVQLTTSGEQAFWVFRALPADVLGVSLYRVVQDSVFGVVIFPHSPEVYAVQRMLAELFAQKVIISELQVEPWGIGNERIGEGYGTEAAYKLFTEEDVRYHMDFARKTGASEIFLWGVEWWYYLNVHGEDRLWEAGKSYTTGGHE